MLCMVCSVFLVGRELKYCRYCRVGMSVLRDMFIRACPKIYVSRP